MVIPPRNNEEKTAEAIDEASWMHTGDLATIDEEGYIQIVGRIKDMVIRGGENIYPKEIEEFLYTHPAIEEVQVTGVPDDKYGEELIAWVKLKPEADSVTGAELREFCKGQIAHFKIPRNYKFLDEFPMTGPGKSRSSRCGRFLLRRAVEAVATKKRPVSPGAVINLIALIKDDFEVVLKCLFYPHRESPLIC